MKKRTNLWSLIGAQMVCTALGLWMQERYMAAEFQKLLVESAKVSTPADAAEMLATVGSSMLGIRAITFVWMNGLLGMIVYIVVSHVHDEFSRSGGQPAVEALRRTTDLLRTQDAVIFGLAKLADSRDPETGDHLERISLYSSTLASALRRHDLYREVVTAAFVQYIGTSSALHDIGKVGVEDSILRKPGPLTPAERRRIEEHAGIGERCLKEIERRLGSSNFLRMAREIATAHHERWDGMGYPAGLKGKDIPLSARIVAIADVYDALSTKRVYKDALPHAQCVDVIRREAGKQFDPQLVDVFLEIAPAFENIARRFAAPRLTAADTILVEIDRSLKIAAPQSSGPAPEKEETTTCCQTLYRESERS